MEWRLQLSVAPDFFNGVWNCKYGNILDILNFLKIHLSRRHLDTVFLFCTFKCKISCSSVPDTVCLILCTKSIRDCLCCVYVNRIFRVSPSAGCVAAAIAVSRTVDIFNKCCVWLTDISGPVTSGKLSLFFNLLFVLIVFYYFFILLLACNWSRQLLSRTLINRLKWIISSIF
jgi:hypothetical protein